MRHLTNWLPDYLMWRVFRSFQRASSGITHIMVLFVDHFELAGKEPRLSEWLTRYPRLAARHGDVHGVPPKHTWFYALDLMREEELERLRELVDAGLGEIELHWHHAHDTADTFQEKLNRGLEIFRKHGFLLPVDQSKPGCFAFIHGNWSLNNSRGAKYCGVDNEIELLKQAGCYGDFTFPALHSIAQPSLVNSIYYAGFDAGRAGYNRGRRARVGCKEREDEFLIFQGPLVVNCRDWRFKWHPTLEDGDIGKSLTHNDPRRIDAWIRAAIHVQGRPDWVFVKIFCHGGQDHQAVLGDKTDAMFSYLEKAYNDGVRYCLHYVTAREAYNIVKAAEDGMTGDPHQYRNYRIPLVR